MDQHIITHFQKADPILYAVFSRTTISPLKKRTEEEYFSALTSTIIGQQLSGRVADVIYDRFTALFPKKKVTPEHLLTLSHDALRASGMSNAKAYSLKDLAHKVLQKEIDLAHLERLDDELVITELTKVKGIGRWTAEMFLMFSLGRPDLFSVGDQGLKNAIKKLYNVSEITPEVLLSLSAKWAPYRTYACLLLWRSLES